MVSNFERIYSEITREAERLASENDLPSDVLTEVVMEIVELEDRHQMRPTNVDQKMREVIEAAAARCRVTGEEA